MHRDGAMSFLQRAAFSAVDLPYGNSTYSMTILMPSPGQRLDAVVASLQTSAWSGWSTQFREAEVDLYLPRLELAWRRKLIPDLQALGMRAPFDDTRADFSRMSSTGQSLVISTVVQKTYVDVNEDGTEACDERRRERHLSAGSHDVPRRSSVRAADPRASFRHHPLHGRDPTHALTVPAHPSQI